MASDTGATPGVLPFKRPVAHRHHGAADIDADETRVWDVEAVPLLITIGERGSERPVLMLVTAGELILHADIRGRLGGGGGKVAVALECALADAARKTRVWPEEVRVRHESVADALRPLLEARDVRVTVADPLPAIEEAARSLMGEVTGDVLWPPVCRTRTWAAWDLPGALMSDTFLAAAEFWRAAPWRFASNMQAPRLTLPVGREWTVCVLGNAGEEYGLSLYSDGDDLFERMAVSTHDAPFGTVRGQIVALTFDRLADLPRETQKEARMRRWEVAGPPRFRHSSQ